jgi:hypothetical protein
MQLAQGMNVIQERIQSIFGGSNKVLPTAQLEDALNCEFFAYELRIKGAAYYGFSALSFSASENRMRKRSDIFVVREVLSDKIVVQNRYTKEMATIPRSAIVKQIRRISNITRMDISDDNEFVVARPFGELDQLLKKVYPTDRAKVFERRIREEWPQKVDHGLSNIVFVRKLDLSAPGTRLLGFFSSSPVSLCRYLGY